MANGLTRIYQGRINKVLVDGSPLTKEQYTGMIWKHHEVFQDAVNYYLLALAAMADPSQDSAVSKMRQAMSSTWDEFTRNGVRRPGMKESIARVFQCSENLTIEEAFSKVLACNSTPQHILHAAVSVIAESCEGDVIQPAGKYLPRCCHKSYDGLFDYGDIKNDDRDGIAKLLEVLHETDNQKMLSHFQSIKNDMQIGWMLQTKKDCYSPTEFCTMVRDAIDFFLQFTPKKDTDNIVAQIINEEKLNGYKQRLDEIKINDKSIRRVGTGKRNDIVLYAGILAMAFADEHSLDLLKTQIKAIETRQKKLGDVSSDGDPIEFSRGERGYIFPSFTSLSFWENEWKELDKESFVEALKTLNQFQQKTKERKQELDKVQACLKWMLEGISSDGKPPKRDEDESDVSDEEETHALPVLKDDPRWLQLQKILTTHLAVKNEFTNDDVQDYGLSERTIRGAREVFRKWNEIMSKTGDAPPAEKQIELKRALDDFQTNNRQTIGSAPLFNELLEPENHLIWDKNKKPTGKYVSSDILSDAVRFFELQEDEEFLKEPIKFSPADGLHSRRLSNLKALTGTRQSKTTGGMGWKVGYGIQGANSLVTAMITEQDGKLMRKDVTLGFTAPRLLRDQLICKGIPVYCPPLAGAFMGVSEKEDGDAHILSELQKSAVQLMPDIDRKGHMRLLLNFQPSIPVTEIRECVGEVFDDKQFYGIKDEKWALRWPDYGKSDELNWYQKEASFDIVAVDLGQRTCGALSRLRISREKDKYSVFVGNDGTNNWYARQVFGTLLRLPGENRVGSDGKEELSGAAGRLATVDETQAALSICRELVGEKEGTEFLVNELSTVQDTIGEYIYEKYFPVQNDRLLQAFRRGLSRLRSLARWHYFNVSGQIDSVQKEIEEAKWLSDKSLSGIQQNELKARVDLKRLLLQITERILPLRGRHWELGNTEAGGFVLRQSSPSSADNGRWICGQRGLSFARLEQLEKLRHCYQSLNRILMEKPGAKRKTPKEMRGQSIPDCCPDILMRLNELKEQRINQTANMILAQALGVRQKLHSPDSRSERDNAGIHAEYEPIPGVPMAKFIVIENLSRYRFSQDRSRFENSRLMKWSHGAIKKKLKMLCEIYGMTVVEVNASYSSKFSADGIPGFRAEELDWREVYRKSSFYSKDANDERMRQIIDGLVGRAQTKNRTVLLPKVGGPIFIPFCPENGDRRFVQADLNAAFNLGLRAVAHAGNLLVHHKLTVDKVKEQWKIRLKSELAKKIFDKSVRFTLPMGFAPEKSVLNLFVCGCLCSELGVLSALTEDMTLSVHNGRCMIGGSIWKNRSLELKRCLEINNRRLLN